MYFNNDNGERYEILARIGNDVMLLQTMNGNYIVARWINDNSWGAGHYWMNNRSGAWKDFFKLAYEISGADLSYKEFIEMFREV
jgi:hypothetical protein